MNSIISRAAAPSTWPNYDLIPGDVAASIMALLSKKDAIALSSACVALRRIFYTHPQLQSHRALLTRTIGFHRLMSGTCPKEHVQVTQTLPPIAEITRNRWTRCQQSFRLSGEHIVERMLAPQHQWFDIVHVRDTGPTGLLRSYLRVVPNANNSKNSVCDSHLGSLSEATHCFATQRSAVIVGSKRDARGERLLLLRDLTTGQPAGGGEILPLDSTCLPFTGDTMINARDPFMTLFQPVSLTKGDERVYLLTLSSLSLRSITVAGLTSLINIPKNEMLLDFYTSGDNLVVITDPTPAFPTTFKCYTVSYTGPLYIQKAVKKAPVVVTRETPPQPIPREPEPVEERKQKRDPGCVIL